MRGGRGETTSYNFDQVWSVAPDSGFGNYSSSRMIIILIKLQTM